MRILSIALAIITVAVVAGGYFLGRTSAFEDIISEKCWLDKETRDINCISYIAK